MYCRTQLGELQQSLSEIRELGAEVWAVSSTDSVEKIAALARAGGFTFPLLSDRSLEVTKRYGVLNEARPNIAHPATLIIDRKGTVRYLRVDVDFTERPSTKELIRALKKLDD